MIRAAKILTLTVMLLGAALAASGCGKAEDETDSESHFLSFCTDDCSDGLSCVCGVCTKTCDADSACQGLAFGARCAALAVSSCAANNGELACDLECSTDAECSGLDGNHECISGRCRARADGLSSRIPADAAAAPAPDDFEAPPLVWPTPDASCCLGTGMFWPLHEVSEDCTFERRGDPVALCESKLPTVCNDPARVDGADILAALQHPEVAAQIEEENRNPPTSASFFRYGWDGADPNTLPARVGAWAFSVDYWPYTCGEIVNGNSAPDDCVDMPEGTRQFVELMDTLLMQQLGLGTCAPSLGCYQPVTTGACDPRPVATYDVASAQCVSGPSCALDGNSFESLLACDRACSNDPCALGEPIGDEACSGVIARPLAAPLSPRCFANETQACICACAQTGGSLDSCIIQQGAPAEAACGQ